jgi:preprotein translocase subunit YajC
VPQRRRQRRAAEELLELIELLQPGDEIITAGGIHGTVRAVYEEELEVEIAAGVEVRLDRRAVAAVTTIDDGNTELRNEEERPVPQGDSGRAAGR